MFDIADITARMAVLSERLSQIKSKREKLVTQLQEIDTESATIQREYKSLHNNKSSIATLPDEIFAAVLEIGRNIDADFLITVSHVTRPWRTIALETPRLWTIIADTADRRWGKQRFWAYLKRSGPLPVCLSVYISNKNMVDIIRLIEVHGARIFQLNLSISRGCDHERFLSIMVDYPVPMYNVKHLVLKRIGGRVFTTHQLSRRFPALISLHISGLNPSIRLEALPSLTAVHFSCRHLRSVQDIIELRDTLTHSPALTQLKLDFQKAAVFWPSELVLELPGLQILSIKGSPADVAFHISGIMNALRAPMLRMLALRGELQNAYNILSPQMISWSQEFPRLRTLQCPHFPNNAPNILFAFAQTLPDITDLTYVENNRDLITLLQRCDNDGPVWPHLRSLSLLRMIGEYFTNAEIIELVAFRRDIGHPIEVIRLQEKRMGVLQIEQLQLLTGFRSIQMPGNAVCPAMFFILFLPVSNPYLDRETCNLVNLQLLLAALITMASAPHSSLTGNPPPRTPKHEFKSSGIEYNVSDFRQRIDVSVAGGGPGMHSISLYVTYKTGLSLR
ncbi:hypothetical protein FIBSPDRAFT_991878 [Athelia psychrophila]|uniref:Uncharacterized protein n=1 Tax=Athelia psychrophila TaxID=1759441 RepID=A0A166S560_9AGAM|nr:hypothetical protein FIBSPDRAFT_991878 [Fibularhizoctonia sp. CBS 109695]